MPPYQQSMPQQAQLLQDNGFYIPSNFGTPTNPKTRINPTPATYKPYPLDARSKSMPGGTSRPVFPNRSTNNDEFEQTTQILNKLKLKNELMQHDIQMMMNDTPAGSTRPFPSVVQSRQPSMTPILSAKERLAQAMQRPIPSVFQSRQPSMALSQRVDNTQGYRSR